MVEEQVLVAQDISRLPWERDNAWLHGGLPGDGVSLAYWVSIAIQCHERRRQRKALLELDDRMLADIGITKSQAIDEAQKPFWK